MTGTHHLVARTGEDLLACAVLTLGFVPEDSVVMIGLAGGSPHARVDLGGPEDLPEVCAALVGPATLHGVSRVVLCLFADLDRVVPVSRVLLGAFAGAGIEVVGLVAHDGAVWVPVHPVPGERGPRPFDVLSHPFVTEAVVGGRVVLASRAALVGSLAPDPVRVARTEALLPVVARPGADWVESTLRRLASRGDLPDERETTALVLAVGEPALRDVAWAHARREEARALVDVWRAVVRSTPRSHLAAPAAVLAFHAWLAGDGALAWCAVDASRSGHVPCSLATLVAELLEQATSPEAWSGGALALRPGGDHQSGGAA